MKVIVTDKLGDSLSVIVAVKLSPSSVLEPSFVVSHKVSPLKSNTSFKNISEL